ncbi:MAG TPA: ABC transporter ATP-binding protein [Beijerinckiaceae bacterium]|nr:ABC transporter ATP-binding protein [Rhodoblastus sp.]MCO5086097.1 ABC transporter ATP-binding protein [Methylobacteriaceae bacterium]HRY01986.1 ABC transporter ATP-binding protein [Beijerinckiaceae bacterium]
MTAPLLKVSGLEAFYGAAQILFSVEFELAPGEVVALMGRNGAGKTTTLESIMGLVDRRSGSVDFRGHELIGLRTYEIARLGLGFVPEDRRIFTDLTVIENLEVGRRNPSDAAQEPWTPDRLFSLFPNLAEARDRSAGRMSGGEQQMLTIARTLMGNPLAILLDEPSEGIAPIIVDQMIDMIAELKKSGVAILVSEQNLPFAAAVADRAYVLDHGQIKYSGAIASLLNDEEVRRTYLEL